MFIRDLDSALFEIIGNHEALHELHGWIETNPERYRRLRSSNELVRSFRKHLGGLLQKAIDRAYTEKVISIYESS